MPTIISPCARNTTPYDQLVTSSALLRAYYKLDEQAGTTMVDSGPLALHGAYVGAPTLAQPPLASGFSVLFSAAVPNYGTVGNIASTVSTGEHSVVCWMKSTQAAGLPALLVCADNNNFRYFQLRIEASGVAGYLCFTAGAPPVVQQVSTTVVNDGAVHMLCGVQDATRAMTLYIDGLQDGATIAGPTAFTTNAQELRLGSRNAFGTFNPYTGTLDEVSIYNGALTAAEVAALWSAG